MGALNELQYRINFWIQLFNSALSLGTGLVAIAVVYAHTEALEGWSAAELLAVLGVHLLIGGFLKTFVVPNMWRLIQDVEEGTLDYTLTRPADSQLLVSVREVSIWSVIDVVLGFGVIMWAVSRMTAAVTPVGVAGFLVALICGAAITVPAEIITNRINWWWLAAGVAVTVGALFVCRLVWRWGIRNYSGASA